MGTNRFRRRDQAEAGRGRDLRFDHRGQRDGRRDAGGDGTEPRDRLGPLPFCTQCVRFGLRTGFCVPDNPHGAM